MDDSEKPRRLTILGILSWLALFLQFIYSLQDPENLERAGCFVILLFATLVLTAVIQWRGP